MSRLGLRLREVVKRFGEISAANGVTLELETGQLLALLGPSGCGKTTTLRLIAGFEAPDAGCIEIDGNVMAGPAVYVKPEKRRVGMVFQEYALFPHLNVRDNVRFGLHRYGELQEGSAFLSWRPPERLRKTFRQDRRVTEVLELVGLRGLERRMPHELSGGQQQRVALARALAPEPALILLDEPFSNLDAGLRVRVRQEVRSILKQASATAIFVTHDQEEALSLVDQIAVMLRGRVQQVASPHDLYDRPATREVAEFIGNANFLPAVAHGTQVECELGILEVQSDLVGPVDVLIRPENIDLTPAGGHRADLPDHYRSRAEENKNPAKPAGRVHSQLFFGHDQLIAVVLNSGRLIDVRTSPDQRFVVGQPVHVLVRGPVITFPRDL